MSDTQTFVVRWGECDVNGHMRNTTYSEYGVEARVAFLAARGFAYARLRELGLGPVLLREEIDYLHELHLGDAVEVDLTRLGHSPDGARFRLAHDFRRPGGKLAARVVVLGAWMDLRTRRLTAPPEELRRAIADAVAGEPYEELPPLRRSRAT